MKTEPDIIERSPSLAVGLCQHTSLSSCQNQIPPLWQAMFERMDTLTYRCYPNRMLGLMDHYDPVAKSFDYLAAVEVGEDANVPEGMLCWPIQGGTYAVFEAHLAELGRLFEYIYQHWLPASDYLRATGPEFESYDQHFDPADPSAVLQVYIPLLMRA